MSSLYPNTPIFAQFSSESLLIISQCLPFVSEYVTSHVYLPGEYVPKTMKNKCDQCGLLCNPSCSHCVKHCTSGPCRSCAERIVLCQMSLFLTSPPLSIICPCSSSHTLPSGISSDLLKKFWGANLCGAFSCASFNNSAPHLDVNPHTLGVVGNNLSDIKAKLSGSAVPVGELPAISCVALAMNNAFSFIRLPKISTGALPAEVAQGNLGGGGGGLGGKKEALDSLFIPNNLSAVNQVCWALASDNKQLKFVSFPPMFSLLDIPDLPPSVKSVVFVPGLVAIPLSKHQDWTARVSGGGGYSYTRALNSYLHTATSGETAVLSHCVTPGGCCFVFDQSSSHLLVEYEIIVPAQAKCSLVLCLCSETKTKLNSFKLNDLLIKLEKGLATIEQIEHLTGETPFSLFQKHPLKDGVVYFSRCIHSRPYRNIMRKLQEPHCISNFVQKHLKTLEDNDIERESRKNEAAKAALEYKAGVDELAMRERKAATMQKAFDELLKRRLDANVDDMVDPLKSKVVNGLLWGMCSKCKKWRKMWDGTLLSDLKGLWTCDKRLDINCGSPEEPNDGAPLSMDLALNLAREAALDAVLAATKAGERDKTAKDFVQAVTAQGPAGKRFREASGKAGFKGEEEVHFLPEKFFSPLAYIRPRPGPYGKSGRFAAVVQTGGPFSVTSLSVVHTGGGAARCSLHTSGHMCACASLLSRCLDAKNELEPPPPPRTGTHDAALAFEPQSYIQRTIKEVGRREGSDVVDRHTSGPCSNCTPCLHAISTTPMAPPSAFHVKVALTLQRVLPGGGGGGSEEGGCAGGEGGVTAPTQLLAFDDLPPIESMEDAISLGKFPLHRLIANPSASPSTNSTFSFHTSTHNGRTRLQVSLSGSGDAQVSEDIVLTTEEPTATLTFRTIIF